MIDMSQMTPEKFLQLSMTVDPMPILASMKTGGGITNTADGTWQNMIQGNPTAPAGGLPGADGKATPLDPKTMAGLMPQQQQNRPQFIGGATPRQPGQVSLALPDFSSLMRIAQAGQPTAAVQAPTLTQLLQGR